MNHLSVALFLIAFLQSVSSAPIVVTREHTASAVTVTDTYSTVTNTHTAPTVEVLVSDGATYTYTLTDASYDQATTFTTTIVGKQVLPSTTSSTEATTTSSTEATTTSSTEAATTEAATTEAATTSSTGAAITTSGTEATTSSTDAQSTTSSVHSTTTLTPNAPTSMNTRVATSSTTSEDATTSSTTSTSSTSESASSTGKLSSVPSAIVYSPYNNDSSCKDYDTVKTDLTLIANTGISVIRMYATDCDSLETVQPNAVELGLKINQGFWISDSGADSIDDSVSDVISYGEENGWDVFDFITIGNEAIQSGYCTVDELKSKISSVKTKLQNAGYTGKVTTAEPPVTFEDNPDLCNADVDFIGINPHAYFDENSSAETAGSFVQGQIEIVEAICPDKSIVVTETGYPSAGDTNGNNVPSPENQRIAIEKLLSVLDGEFTLLSTYNDFWKSPGDYGIEQWFGAIQLFTN